MPVEWEGEPDHPSFGRALVVPPGGVGLGFGLETPVVGFEAVCGCPVVFCAHVAQARDAEFECLGGVVGRYSFYGVDEVLSLEDRFAGFGVVCEGNHVWTC